MMIRSFIALTLMVFIVAGVIELGFAQKARKDGKKKSITVISYKKDIVPVVKRYCLPCHTEDQMNPSELYLDSYDNMMAGGKHGKPIVPGKADSSLIVKKLGPRPPVGDPMPLKRKTPFPADTLAVIKEWINQGAKNN